MDGYFILCILFSSISSEPQRCAQALALGTPKGAGCEAAFDAPAAPQEEDEKAERQQGVFVGIFSSIGFATETWLISQVSVCETPKGKHGPGEPVEQGCG